MTKPLRFVLIGHILTVGLLSISAQQVIIVKHKAGYPALALGVHSSTDNGSASSATVVVGPITPTPTANSPSTIVCSLSYSSSARFTSVADNVNSGYYLPAASLMRDYNHHQTGGIYYHENVAAAATTITLTYSPAESYGRMACLELKNVPKAYGADSSFVAGQTGDSNSAKTGSGLTPFGNSRFVYGLAQSEGGTASPGSGYTYLDTQTGTSGYQLLPEYQIQTAAASTDAPQSFSGTEYWGDQMAAWAPQQSGTCGLSTVIDWAGGTAGNHPAAADLNSSTHGGTPQPNADRAYEGGLGSSSNLPGWAVEGTTGKIYSTSAYAPLQTQRSCPFYSGSGTTSNTLGLQWSTGTSSSSNNTVLHFDTTSNTVTCWACMMATVPTSPGGQTADVITIMRSDGSDYANIQWNSGGWALETISGDTGDSSFTWTPGTWYGILLTYQGASGNHTASFYSYTGSQCTGTATLLGTLSEPTEAKGPPNVLSLPLGEANSTYASGYSFNVGAIELDYLYGAALSP
jgi:hypothetical protein